MAKREPRKPQPASAGEDDLAVLHPNLTATIGGREVVVREYGFIEGLGLRRLMQPLLDDMYEAMSNGSVPPLEQILVVISNHSEAVALLMAKAADVDIDWVRALNQDDGYSLLYLWWTANGPFVVRAVIDRIRSERAVDSLHAGPTSTQS